MGTISNSSSLGADQPGSATTLSFTPAPIGSQSAEPQDGRGRTRAAFAYVWQRPRWLFRFLAGFIVIVALAWKGLNMGQAPVPRQSQAPDIESGMLLAQNAPAPDTSPSVTPEPAPVSEEAASPDATTPSTTPKSSVSTVPASSNSKTAVSQSKKHSKYASSKRKSNRSARTSRHIKLIASPVGDHAGVTYIKLP